MARVFVSFATADLLVATEVAEWLRNDGHDVFLDRDAVSGIRAGERWRRRIYQELLRVDAVISLVTSDSAASTWCAAELGIADALGCLLIPLRVTHKASHPLLKHRQYTDYARDPEVARAAVLESLRHLDGGFVRLPWRDGANPFPGLEPFTPSSSSVYFGRAAEVGELAKRLRVPRSRTGRILAIVGSSGCGKSSLINAGLIPRLAQDADWLTTPPWFPGEDPFSGLARALTHAARQSGIDWSMPDVRNRLETDSDSLRSLTAELLSASRNSKAHRVLIAVDQGEELFTRVDDRVRERLAELLSRAARNSAQPVITLRSEFLDDLRDVGGFERVPMDVFPLPPLSSARLRSVIKEPARVAGLRLERGLVARLVEDTGSGEALPLLAFTLRELSDGLRRGDTLGLSRYIALGGVQGALTRHADAALKTAVEAANITDKEILAALVRLVTIDDAGRWSGLQIDMAGWPPRTRDALQILADQRLLVVGSHSGVETIEVAHEALLTAWTPLQAAISEHQVALQSARAAEHAAAEWHQAGQPGHYLWDQERLAGALVNLGMPTARDDIGFASSTGYAVHLNVQAQSFLEASASRIRAAQARATRLRHRTVIVLSTLLALAVVAASLAVWQAAEAREGQRVAVARQLLARTEGLLYTDPHTALLLAEAAHRVHPDPTTDAGLVHALRSTRFAFTLEGHRSLVWSATFAPDGKTLATASSDGTIRLWDMSTRSRPQPLGEPLGSLANPRSVAFSPDGRILASTSDNSVVLFDVTDPSRPRALPRPLTGHTRFVWSVAFSPDGQTLASGSADATIILWDLTQPERANQLGPPLSGHAGDVNSVAFAPDGRTLVSASHDSSVALWDLTDRARPHRLGNPLTAHTGLVWSAKFNPDGRRLATASADGTTILWDVTDKLLPRRIGVPLAEHREPVLALAFTPDGRTLATASGDQTVLVWDVSNPSEPPRLRDRLEGHTDAVLSVAFSPDGQQLATGGWDNKTMIWDLADPAQPERLGSPLTGHTDIVSSVVFSPDGGLLATAGRDGAIRLWDVGKPKQPRPVGNPLRDHAGAITSLVFSPNGRTLISSGDDGVVLLWDVTDRTDVRRIGEARSDSTKAVWSVATAPDGSVMACAGDDGTITLWDISDPAKPRRRGQTAHAHTDSILTIAISADGHTLATGSRDQTIKLWDITEPDHVRGLGPPLVGHNSWVSSVAFAPQGHILATASWDRTVLLWDTTNPEAPQRVGQPLAGYGSAVQVVTFDPSGTILATASADLSVLLWDTSDPTQARHFGDRLTGHSQAVLSLAIDPSGHILATASADHTIHLWSLPSVNREAGAAIARACAITGRGLQPAEWSTYAPGMDYEESCPSNS